jgi:hypothetical protein
MAVGDNLEKIRIQWIQLQFARADLRYEQTNLQRACPLRANCETLSAAPAFGNSRSVFPCVDCSMRPQATALQ